jgi:uncharacterized protein YbaA (DUF1428 family)
VDSNAIAWGALEDPKKAEACVGDGIFIDLGALRVVECWADDVPDGKQTDFRRAVQAVADEEIVFSWVEWSDKATRDAALETMKGWMANPESADPRMDATANPMPFDGKRMKARRAASTAWLRHDLPYFYFERPAVSAASPLASLNRQRIKRRRQPRHRARERHRPMPGIARENRQPPWDRRHHVAR